MVLECSSAETGVGATIAPSNQPENGSWADFVMPAKHSSAAGISTSDCLEPISACNSMLWVRWWHQTMASANARPPARFMTSARRALRRASSVRVYPISRNEQRVVISQNRNSQVEVVGENQAEHRAHEDEQQREEQRPPVPHLGVGDFVIFPHVTQGIDADAAADQAVDQGHDHGELVHKQIRGDHEVRAGGDFEPNHHRHLGQREQHDQQVFRTHPDVDDVGAHRDLDGQNPPSDPMGCQGSREIRRLRQGRQRNDAETDRQGCGRHQDSPRAVGFQAQQPQADSQRHQNE